MINICIPTLNNYNGLIQMIHSLESGSLKPDKYYVLDNGNKLLFESTSNITVLPQKINLGVAGSWNWFIENVPDKRIILNDDLLFYKFSLEDFVNSFEDDKLCAVDTEAGLNMFSCFYLPDSVVEKVGKFDTNFHPAYFEDNDYFYRMFLKGVEHKCIKTDIFHAGSQTLKNFSDRELNTHHTNFRKNRDYFKQKWGGLPGAEVYTSPFNRE